MVNFECDYIYGEQQENKLYEIIKNGFEWSTPLQKGTRYSKYDYYNDDTNIELKSRKNKYKTYPTTMLTLNKLSTDKELLLLFNFIDGVYFIQYDKDMFSKFEVKDFSRANLRGDEKKHIYIPITKLELLHQW
jgi:hypothetical protein